MIVKSVRDATDFFTSVGIPVLFSVEVEGDPGHHRNCQAMIDAVSLTSSSAEVNRQNSQVLHPKSTKKRITRH